MVRTSGTTEQVRAFEGTLTLPTYAIRGENPNPVFHSQYGVAHIYPYTLLDDIAPTPCDRTYRTLVLENRYLRLTVLPELGGRVYSLYDKVSQREVFYKNPVVKFAPLAIRGAFFSGGLEFSFPVAHAPTTADPVNWDLRANPDGSATVACGGLEHMAGMRWTISLTLYPDRCALAQDVKLHNPTLVPGRYHYWTNASLAADDQTEFVYPLRRLRSYEFAGSASWPVARMDLITGDARLEGMEGVPKWPAGRLHEPMNLRWQKNMIAQVSIFGRDVRWDFFGAWQHALDCGYAHFASHRDVAGMKLWSWGNAGTGIMNQAALTDDGSLYAETQCGAMETQLDFALLPPGQTRCWREWWLPLRGLGGLTCASADLGARLGLAPAGAPGQVELTMGLCPVRNLGRATVTVATPRQTLWQGEAELTPERPWLHTANLRARDLGADPITLMVIDEANAIALAYTVDREAEPVEPFQSQVAGRPTVAQEHYDLGIKHENFDNREDARRAYEAALAADPAHGPSHLRLGLMLLRAADLAGAETHLREAAAAGEAEASYYLGTVLLYQDRLQEAQACFRAVPSGTTVSAAALAGLGRVADEAGAWEEAAKAFGQAYSADPTSITFQVLEAAALRRAGREVEARRALVDVLRRDPLNHAALREMAALAGQAGAPYKATLGRLLADDHQYWLDLACFYMEARLFADALDVLDEAAAGWRYPLVGYLAGKLCRRLGRQADAAQWWARAAEADPDLVFPSRLAEAQVLAQVVAENPGDSKARYYLGNYYYARQRYDEGVRLWEEALAGLGDFDVILRSLGLAYWQHGGDLERGAALLEKALAINSRSQDLYLHLDALYATQGRDDKRAALLEKMRALDDPRDDVHKRIVVVLVDLGRYEEAIHILEADRFVASEMDQSFRLAYVRAYLARAAERAAAGDLEGAVGSYRRALEFPKNVGVGRPVSSGDAEILYGLGCACERLGRYDEALAAWRQAAGEHHEHGSTLFPFVQMSLDKLSRYGELRYGDV